MKTETICTLTRDERTDLSPKRIEELDYFVGRYLKAHEKETSPGWAAARRIRGNQFSPADMRAFILCVNEMADRADQSALDMEQESETVCDSFSLNAYKGIADVIRTDAARVRIEAAILSDAFEAELRGDPV